jgi:hypothetical protein
MMPLGEHSCIIPLIPSSGALPDTPLLQAEELASLLRRHDLMSHVNVIPWNPVDESEFKRPSGEYWPIL